MRLLRAISDQAKGRVGETVAPNEAAQYAGLKSGDDDYGEALQYLVDRGALVEDERYGNVVGGPPQVNVVWILTQTGLNMLGEEE